jgi:hypothetical protein
MQATMNTITEYIKDHAVDIVLGALILATVIYALFPNYMSGISHPEAYQQQQSLRPQFPWHPGMPRNPRECVARGGVDMGTWCHHYH